MTTYKYAIKYSEKQQQQPPFPRGSRGFLENGGRASEDTHPQISVDNQGRVSMEKNTAATEGRMAPDKGRAASQDSPAPDNKAVPVGRTDPVKAGESFEKKSGMAECWLFMELCNKGTLQVTYSAVAASHKCCVLTYKSTSSCSHKCHAYLCCAEHLKQAGVKAIAYLKHHASAQHHC